MSIWQLWQWQVTGLFAKGGSAYGCVRITLLIGGVLLLATGCATRQDHHTITSNQSPIKPTEFPEPCRSHGHTGHAQ